MKSDAETSPWDAAEVLDSPEMFEAYLEAAFETGDPQFIARALGTIARARNLSQIARDAGMTRAALYRTFSGKTNPEFATIMNILRALDLSLVPVTRKPDTAA